MTNRSARQGGFARVRNVYPRRISAAERLRTLNLYMQLGDTNAVGEILGIAGSSVRDRLWAMEVKTRTRGQGYGSSPPPSELNDEATIRRLRLRLHRQIARERAGA